MEKQEKQAIEILHMMCGNNGCVISDSGGKDSSVLKHMRNSYKECLESDLSDLLDYVVFQVEYDREK